MVVGPNGDSIGSVLRQERLRRRLSLIDVGEQTKINPRLLEAIENDDDRTLPAQVFTVGLITSYARFLQLNPEPIVAAYRARSTYREPVRRGPRPYRESMRLPRLAVPGVAVGLVVALAAYLYQQYATYVTDSQLLVPRPLAQAAVLPPTPRGDADPMLEPPTSTPIPPTPTAAPTAPAAPVGPRGTPPPAVPTATPLPPPTPTPTAPKEVDISAKARARVWVQVQADDKVIFSGILNAGDSRTWTAKQKLLIWAGNGDSLEVTFNGKPLGTIGRPGEVVRVTWTAPP